MNKYKPFPTISIQFALFTLPYINVNLRTLKKQEYLISSIDNALFVNTYIGNSQIKFQLGLAGQEGQPGLTSGAGNRQKGVISGAGNPQKGLQILYHFFQHQPFLTTQFSIFVMFLPILKGGAIPICFAFFIFYVQYKFA